MYAWVLVVLLCFARKLEVGEADRYDEKRVGNVETVALVEIGIGSYKRDRRDALGGRGV